LLERQLADRDGVASRIEAATRSGESVRIARDGAGRPVVTMTTAVRARNAQGGRRMIRSRERAIIVGGVERSPDRTDPEPVGAEILHPAGLTPAGTATPAP